MMNKDNKKKKGFPGPGGPGMPPMDPSKMTELPGLGEPPEVFLRYSRIAKKNGRRGFGGPRGPVSAAVPAASWTPAP